MSFRATTREQFRTVLNWVKEHPVLARSDNEVEKGGRELKNKLWEKLAIELNEIGPPVRTWMGWKRVLTDYKYSLKKKIQRRIANTSQGGTEILASLSELETEALHASLLEWDFSDIDKMQTSDTPPFDDVPMQDKSPEGLSTASQDSQGKNENMNITSNVNGIAGSAEAFNQQNYNVNGEPVMKQSPTEIPDVEVKLESPYPDNDMPNGYINLFPSNIINMTTNGSQVMQESTQATIQMQATIPENPDVSALNLIKSEENVQMITTPYQEYTQNPNGLVQTASIAATPMDTSAPQNVAIPNSTANVESEPVDAAQSAQQPEQQKSSDPNRTLSTEEMNALIAREIDRMAKTQKTRKTAQRRRETRDKTKSMAEAVAPEEKEKPQKERAKAAKEKPAEPEERVKRVAPKRPKPNIPKEGKDGKAGKRFMTGREFRHCLLTLLAEANEMEKRRIAITETKVRNQTEIQNLEITRMNLEIMKLQKEITLLDHGAKILP